MGCQIPSPLLTAAEPRPDDGLDAGRDGGGAGEGGPNGGQRGRAQLGAGRHQAKGAPLAVALVAGDDCGCVCGQI